MTWADWFTLIRSDVTRLRRAKTRLEELRADTGTSAHYGSGGHGTAGSGKMAGRAARAVDLEAECYRLESRLHPAIAEARTLLYGPAGVAQMRSYVDADCIDGYYLQGLTWSKVARETAVEDKDYQAGKWCRMRALRALEWMDDNVTYSSAE